MIIRFPEKLRKKLKPGSISTEANSPYTAVMDGRGIVEDNSFIQKFLSQLRGQLEDVDCRIIFERIIAPDTHRITMSKQLTNQFLDR
jgi:hypothetical protein